MNEKSDRLSIISAPFCLGQPKSGTELGPDALLDYGLETQLRSLGWNTKVKKISFKRPESDEPYDHIKNPRSVGLICNHVSDAVTRSLREKNLVLTLGGDHSLGLGTVSGTSRVFGQEYCVLWIDAHGDINTLNTTDSGNMHGMPISFLLKLNGNEGIPGFDWLYEKDGTPLLRKDRIAFIGLRDLDAGEKKLLRENNITAYSMYHVDKFGINQVIQMALDQINPHRLLPIHLSFDVDALDPTVAPATGTPVRGGLTFREGHFICEEIWKTGLLAAVDIMEVNPTLGNEQQRAQTTQVGCSLARSALGETLY